MKVCKLQDSVLKMGTCSTVRLINNKNVNANLPVRCTSFFVLFLERLFLIKVFVDCITFGIMAQTGTRCWKRKIPVAISYGD